jgi:trigger factor
LSESLCRGLRGDPTPEADAQVRQALVQQIVEANNVQAPESLVHRLMHNYAEMYQVPQEQLERFEQQFHQVAEAQVRRDLVLDAVVEANALRATEAELDARVAELAASRGVPASQVYGNLQKANRLPELERAITEEKAFAWLLQQSTIDEVKS